MPRPARDVPGAGREGAPSAPAAPGARAVRSVPVRILAALGWTALGIAGTALGLAAVLLWRLSVRPLDVTALARRVIGAEAPGVPCRLDRLTLRWDAFRFGDGAPVVVAVDGLTLGAGASADRVDHLRVALAPAPILLGRIAPERIDVAGARLAIARERGGGLNVLPGRGTPSGHAHSRSGAGGSVALDWRALRDVSVDDVALAWHDASGGGAAGRLALSRLRASRGPNNGWDGHGRLTVAPAGAAARARRDAASRAPAVVTLDLGAVPSGTGETVSVATASPVIPADYASVADATAPLAAIATPVGVSLHVLLDDRFRPRAAAANATIGAGTVAVGGTAEPVRAGEVALSFRPGPGPGPGPGDEPTALARGRGVLSLDHLVLRLADGSDGGGGGPVVTARGTLAGDAASRGALAGTLALTLDRVSAASLGTFWPAPFGRWARTWITRNIPVGTIENAAFTIGLTSSDGIGGLGVARLAGGFDGRDLAVHWLRPIPPITGAAGHVALPDLDTVAIALDRGRQGDIDLAGSRMRITGVTANEQPARIAVRARGPLPAMLALLAQPRLGLLSGHPLGFTDPRGDVDLGLVVTLPLDARVTLAGIGIDANATIGHVHLGAVAAGRSLDDATLRLHATGDGLDVTGTGEVDRIPVALDYGMDFRAGPPSEVTARARVTATADADALRRAGLPVGDVATGNAALALRYRVRRDGDAALDLVADLRDAALATPFGWRKPRGAPTVIHAAIGLSHGRLARIGPVDATGPGLLIRSHALCADRRCRGLALDTVVLGRTRASGRVVVSPSANAPIGVVLHGPTLDLAVLASGHGARAVTPANAPARPDGAAQAWTVTLRFDRVLLPGKASLDGVAADLAGEGERPERGRIVARGPTPLDATLRPSAVGRLVDVTAGDAGALFSGLDLTDDLVGGALALHGRFDDRDPGAPFRGDLTITSFTLRRVPWAARLLRDVTVYGLVDRAPSPGIGVTRLDAPITLRGKLLTLKGARVWQPALGLTASGAVDLGSGRLDLTGTIVPAYAINALPGKLPLVGKLFSPEPGGGVFAATWSVRGSADAPTVRVNPLAALVPGVLRRLLAH